MKIYKKYKKELIATIAILGIVIVILLLPLMYAGSYVEAYGLVEFINGTYYLRTEFINCELNRTTLTLRGNVFIIEPLIGEYALITGNLLGNDLLINSVNTNFNLSSCMSVHKDDLRIMIKDYDVLSDENIIISYEVINVQDVKIFYESVMIIDCVLEKNYVTGYLGANSSVGAEFLINCPPGSHVGEVNTIFIDELGNRHYLMESIVVNSFSNP